MALYTLSDLHLPIGIDKPMDIFGGRWTNYVERIEKNWKNIISDNDTVVIGGDFSWATYLDEAKPDFEFIENLPGKKIILKGNHDYWWETISKLNKYKKENGYNSVEFLQNNSFMYGDVAICGTRGWSYLGVGGASDEDKKVYEREVGRFKLSVESAKKNNPKEIYAFFHYPPIGLDKAENGFIKVMQEYGIRHCFYGHLHNASYNNVVEGEHDGIKYMLVSCDYREFVPIKLCD